MKRLAAIGIIGTILIFLFQVPVGVAGNGYMGGRGTIVVEDPPAVEEGDSTTDEGGQPDTVDGPLNDNMADAGKLFGDLYKILRYEGSETKPDGTTAIGGEPILSDEYGVYALEQSDGSYTLADAPYPSQCVQPVADYNKWGDIGFSGNRLPLVMTYDATWERTECEVGELSGASVDPVTGELTLEIDEYYIEPSVSCPDGIKWVDLVDEVSFGRLNLSRSPEAVLQAAFDEAVSAINNATRIERDAAGRLLLTTEIYENSQTYLYDESSEEWVWVCDEVLVETRTKAIDSPLENLALYVKLLKDGHLVTPGDERAPIDRSEKGGIPLWKMLELTDGPSDALRPTIDIDKLKDLGLGSLVDVSPQEYYTYYECYDEAGNAMPCLCEGVNQDNTPVVVACENVASRKLLAVEQCPAAEDNANAESCQGPFEGIKTDDADENGINDYAAQGDDFDFAAAFLAAAADKTGDIGVDMVVYLNSILGINKVIGYSEYDADGDPVDGAVNYSEEPEYFNYKGIGNTDNSNYSRTGTFANRRGTPDVDAGYVRVLQGGGGTWTEIEYKIMNLELEPEPEGFDNIGIDTFGFPTDEIAVSDIRGFAQMADDDLSVIKFTHTYQIPGLR